MALPDYITLIGGTPRSTGISNVQVANGNNYLSTTVINNAQNLDDLADFEIIWQYSTAPSANRSVRLHIQYSFDGQNWEDGASGTVDPIRLTLITAWTPPADTLQHRMIRGSFPLLPYPFRLLVRNHDTGQTITITVNCITRKMAQVID
jgi:hypothetical protein